MSIFRRKATRTPAAQEDLRADIEVARAQRLEASKQYREAITQGFAVTRLTSALAARRAYNGFGDSVQISFTPRR